MEPAATLADHLRAAAARWPQGLAMRTDTRQWTFAEWQAEVEALATTIAPSSRPLIAAGSSLDLARHAAACSLKKRPFFPVDRERAPAAKVSHARSCSAPPTSTPQRRPPTRIWR